MLLDISNTSDFGQVKIYNGELINHIIMNRGLKRLYDNDEAIATHLSGYTNTQFNALDVRLLSVESEVTDFSANNSQIETLCSEVDVLQLTTSNSPNWNTAYTIVDSYYIDWNQAYSTVSANSAAWGGAAGFLSGLNDTDIVSPASGEVIVYDSATGKWSNQTLASLSGSGTSESEVSGIIEFYDNANDWTKSSSYVVSNSANFVTKTLENAITTNSLWVNSDTGSDTSDNLTKSFYSPLKTAAYGLLSGSLFGTTSGSHGTQQIGTININQAVNLDIDLADETLTIDGDSGGGTPANLYLTMIFKNTRPSIYNVPGAEKGHLGRLSGCTFGFADIDINNSYTMFDGFSISNCTFSGTVGQKFMFKNCYIDITTLTIPTSCDFYIDNSCTVYTSADTISSLGVFNKGIPTYTDVSPVSSTFGSFTGPYIFNNSVV